MSLIPCSTLSDRKSLLRKVREQSENRPGVYRMLGKAGEILYVGKSRRIRTRLLSYFRVRGRRKKSGRIIRHAFNIEWSYTPTEFGALLEELRLIKELRPWFNSVYIADEHSRGWIAITDDAFPAIRVVSRSDEPGVQALFGPFRRVANLREAARTLAGILRIRDCSIPPLAPGPISSRSAKVKPHRKVSISRIPGCLRYETGSCPGPCIGQGDPGEYERSVAQALDFLNGNSDAPVESLRIAMLDASRKMEYEHAARLRDRLSILEWLARRVRAFKADADRLTFRYHALAHDGSEQIYFIRRGTVRAELTNADGLAVDEMMAALDERIFHHAPRGVDTIPVHDLEEFHLVASWFRRHPAELDRTVIPVGTPSDRVLLRARSAPSSTPTRSSRKAP